MLRNTKIIILCGGRGQRLGEITNNIPKPLVKLGEKSILEHKLDYYKSQHLNDYIFCIIYVVLFIHTFFNLHH